MHTNLCMASHGVWPQVSPIAEWHNLSEILWRVWEGVRDDRHRPRCLETSSTFSRVITRLPRVKSLFTGYPFSSWLFYWSIARYWSELGPRPSEGHRQLPLTLTRIWTQNLLIMMWMHATHELFHPLTWHWTRFECAVLNLTILRITRTFFPRCYNNSDIIPPWMRSVGRSNRHVSEIQPHPPPTHPYTLNSLFPVFQLSYQWAWVTAFYYSHTHCS